MQVRPALANPVAAPPESRARSRYQDVSLILGPAVAALMLLIGPGDVMADVAWKTAAMGVWMAIWWATEAVPVAVTAFLPLVCFTPLGIAEPKSAAAPYANPIIYLYLGGFMIAITMQKWQLHRRIALIILASCGTNGRSLVGGFMLVAASFSMWMTNTSTTMLLLPIVISVIAVVSDTVEGLEKQQQRNFSICLLLGTAFAATIGGMATLIGTPPNTLLAGFLQENYGIEISFARWMLIGLPFTLIMLPLAWLILTRLIYPITFQTSEETRQHLNQIRDELGSVTAAEFRIGAIFLTVVLGWMCRPWLIKTLGIEGITDTGIVMTAALLLFLVPSGANKGEKLMNWSMTRDLPWSILVLFGGGLSLASAVSESGLALWLGYSLSPLGAFSIAAVVIGTAALVIFMTELTSNLATTATLLPVVAALAAELGQSPLVLSVPLALAASCAFMLPVATPPNAIVYASGKLTVPQMAKAGLALNAIGICFLSLIALFLVPLVLPTT